MSYKRKPYETKELAKENLQRTVIEDALMDDFIRSKVTIDFEDGRYSRYTESKPKEKLVYDIKSFNYFNDELIKTGQEHPKFQNMKFENFVKIFNPRDIFLKELRKQSPNQDHTSSLWNDVFNQDTGLMRVAAIDGYKRILESQGTELDAG